MPQLITLRLANDAGTPQNYPGVPLNIEPATAINVTAVWIGVSADGTTNQAYPINTLLATILLTYPRIYQGIQLTYLGDVLVFFNGMLDYERRVASCCINQQSEESPSVSASASESDVVVPPFQLQMAMNGDSVLITFGMLAGSTSAFVDWGDGSGLEQIDNDGGDQIILDHNYASPGFYNIQVAFMEPEKVTNAVINEPPPGATFNSWLFDEEFAAWFNLDLNSQQIEQLDVTNLPGLSQLSMGGGSNLLTSQNIDSLLQTLDTAGLTNGFFDTTNQNPPAAPGPAGLTAKANLEGKGWTVVTD